MPLDSTQLESQIDSELADNVQRKITPGALRSIIKTAIRWVRDAVNNNLSTWLKTGDGQPGGANGDSVYHTGKMIVGRTTEDTTGQALQTTGISAGSMKVYDGAFNSIFALNTDGQYPAEIMNAVGSSKLAFGANWVSGISDLAFINSNLASYSMSFWRMPTATTKKLLLMLRDGRVGIGTTNPTESLDTDGRVKTLGLVAAGGTPTIAAQSGLGTGGTATIIAGSTDQVGRIRLTPGSTNVNGNATYAILTFNQLFDVAPRFVLLCPRNQEAAREAGKFVALSMSTTGLTIFGANNGNPSSGYNFEFDYFIVK